MDSHLPTLRFIENVVPLTDTLEFGSGEFSTTFFRKASVNHTSIEMYYTSTEQKRQDSLDWYNKSLQFTNDKYHLYLMESVDAVKSLKGKYDLIFVDADMRSQCVNAAFDHTEIIVAHDTEQSWGQWENVVVPPDWAQFTMGEAIWTTTWTINQELIFNFISAGHAERKIPR